MKVYREKHKITAVQITDFTFDNPHPNPEHVIGITYHPVGKFAVITNYPNGIYRLHGDYGTYGIYGQVGDWIICENGLPIHFLADVTFNMYYKLVESK